MHGGYGNGGGGGGYFGGGGGCFGGGGGGGSSYPVTAVTGFDSTATPSVTISYAITKDQCTNGGWETFGVFKNQGDCVSFVATGGANQPALG
jgi:hypothetical protein